MKSITELTYEIDEIKGKIESLKVEKSEKQKEIEDLKSSNIRLLVNSADKERKPASLGAQTNKIGIVQIELEQLTEAISVLEGQQTVLQDALEISKLKAELDTGYYVLRDQYLKKAKEIQSGLKSMVDYGRCLSDMIVEFNKMPIPLLSGGLYRVFKQCKNIEQFKALGIDWVEESARFNLCNSAMTDEQELDKLMNEIKTFSNIFLGLEQNVIPGISSAIPRD